MKKKVIIVFICILLVITLVKQYQQICILNLEIESLSLAINEMAESNYSFNTQMQKDLKDLNLTVYKIEEQLYNRIEEVGNNVVKQVDLNLEVERLIEIYLEADYENVAPQDD